MDHMGARFVMFLATEFEPRIENSEALFPNALPLVAGVSGQLLWWNMISPLLRNLVRLPVRHLNGKSITDAKSM